MSNTREQSFKKQQAQAYAFLDAFYNRTDFGYDVKRWRPSDVNQTIIDIVNQMGDDIYTNTRVMAVATVLFANLIQTLAGGVARNFLEAMILNKISPDTTSETEIMQVTRDNLAQEKEVYRKHSLAWAVVTQVMAREKGNIELAFLGFI